MPLISVYIEFQMAAAIGVYWIFRSIIQTIQKMIVSKIFPVPQYTEEDYKKAEQELGMSNKQKKKLTKQSGEKKYVRSLHHIDDEEWLAAHPAPTDDDDDDAVEGESTESASAPAPIKNDERISYKNKDNK